MGKVWQIVEPVYVKGKYVSDIIMYYTEKEILTIYWDYWKKQMSKKYGEGHELITKENCIEDWVAIHWAWEKKEDE